MKASGEAKERRYAPGLWWGAGILLAVALLPLFSPLCAETEPEAGYYMKERARMVSKDVAARGVTNEAVLAAMGKVPREEYVLSRYRRYAYQDGALPIEAQQTISQPYIVAAMTEAIDPKPDSVVLEVGTGSGYQAAVLAELVDHVYTIEIIDSLAKTAAERLKRMGYTNVTVRAGDGYQGWAEHAPFQGIVVTAAPDHVPQPLVDQLAPGGKMVIPVGGRWDTQELMVIEKGPEGSVLKRDLMPVRFVPMTGEHTGVPPPP